MNRSRWTTTLSLLLAAILLAGCGDKTEKSKTKAKTGDGPQGTAPKVLHGPNGGPMFELAADGGGGEHYHVEWFQDKDRNKFVIVILNEDGGEVAVKVDEVEVEAEIDGKTTSYKFMPVGDGDTHSRFELDHGLAVEGALAPTSGHSHIHVTIDGKEYEAHVFKHSHSH